MRSFVQRWIPLALALTLLSACGTASSNPACVCPPIKEYSKEFQKKLADEVEAAPEGKAFTEALKDYATVRLLLWECRR